MNLFEHLVDVDVVAFASVALLLRLLATKVVLLRLARFLAW